MYEPYQPNHSTYTYTYTYTPTTHREIRTHYIFVHLPADITPRTRAHIMLTS